MKITAVCVDDSQVELDYIARILAECGVTVLARCKMGDEGLREIRTRRPTIALLDIVLSPITGMDILKTIHAEKLPTTPIMCTSMIMLKKQARDAGAAHFIAKPYDEHVTAAELKPILEQLQQGA